MMKAASSGLKASTAVSSRAARLEADSDRSRFSGLLAGPGVGGFVIMLGPGLPDGMEQPVKAHPGRHPFGQCSDRPPEGPSGRPGHGRPRWPGTRSGPGHSGADRADAAQGFATCSWKGSFGQIEKLRTGTYASPKSSLACRNHSRKRDVWNLGKGTWHGVVWSATRTLPAAETASDQVLADMTQQWDTTVSNEEKPTEKARAIRARQRAIGRELRRMYDDVAQEPVPDDFMDLLRQIDEAETPRREEGVVMATLRPLHAPTAPRPRRRSAISRPNCWA